MNNLYAVAILAIAFLVLFITLLVIAALHRRKSVRLSIAIGNQRVESDLFLFRSKWPIVDWVVRKERYFSTNLPGAYRSVGIVLGFFALFVFSLCLYVPSNIASAFGLIMGYVANTYNLQGIERGMEKKSILFLVFAALGVSLGVLVIVLHALAFGDLWDRSVLPVWTPQFSL